MATVKARVGVAETEPFPAYAWPGGYPIVYLSADGSDWCPPCANQTDADPAITGFYVHEEGAPVVCSGGCGRTIDSAYGDPDAET